MASSITGLAAASSTPPPASPAGSEKKTDEAPGNVTKQMFLQLLVTQIRYQDPLNPADGTQFLTQLAQFTNVEQTLAIQNGVAAIRDILEATQQGAPSEKDGTGMVEKP